MVSRWTSVCLSAGNQQCLCHAYHIKQRGSLITEWSSRCNFENLCTIGSMTAIIIVLRKLLYWKKKKKKKKKKNVT